MIDVMVAMFLGSIRKGVFTMADQSSPLRAETASRDAFSQMAALKADLKDGRIIDYRRLPRHSQLAADALIANDTAIPYLNDEGRVVLRKPHPPGLEFIAGQFLQGYEHAGAKARNLAATAFVIAAASALTAIVTRDASQAPLGAAFGLAATGATRFFTAITELGDYTSNSVAGDWDVKDFPVHDNFALGANAIVPGVFAAMLAAKNAPPVVAMTVLFAGTLLVALPTSLPQLVGMARRGLDVLQDRFAPR